MKEDVAMDMYMTVYSDLLGGFKKEGIEVFKNSMISV